MTKEKCPTCPKCGLEATFRDATGTYWDSQAHYWREEAQTAEPAKVGE